MVDRFGDQPHIGPLQGLVPAVVDQDALAIRWVVGQAFRQQIGPVGQLAFQVLGELAALVVVAVVHGALRVRPGRVAPHRGQQPIAKTPHQAEAVPGVVVGHVVQQPLRLGADAAVVILRRPRPLRRALEHRDLARLLRHAAQQLHGTGAGADDGHVLAGQWHVVAPLGAVPMRAGEAVQAANRRQLGPVELPHGSDHRVEPAADGAALGADDVNLPLLLVFMPLQAGGLGVEADVRQQAQVGGHFLLVAPDFVALGVVAAPAQVGRKRVAVEVIRRVDTGLGIGVLEPGAAQLGVFVDQLEGDGQLLQAVGGAQA